MLGEKLNLEIFWALLLCISTNAQIPFAVHSGYSDQYAWVSTNTDSSIIYGYTFSTNGYQAYPYNSILYKRNAFSANIEDSLLLTTSFGQSVFVSDLEIFSDTLYALINVKNGNQCISNYLVRMTSNFLIHDTLFQNVGTINYPELLFMDINPNGDGHSYLFGHLSNSLGVGVIVDISLGSYNTHLLAGTSSVLGKQKLSNGIEKVISWTNAIYSYDSTFSTPHDTTIIYNNGFNIYSVKRYGASLFFYGDAAGATAHFIDSAGNLVKNDSLFSGYQNRPVKTGSHSFAMNQNLILAYVSNSTYPFLTNLPKWISVVNQATDGTVIWKKHFMGDFDYHVYTISETAASESIFLFASRYDWTTQNNERDLYIYKIDKNGSMLGQEEFGGLRQINVLVYPNPFSSSLTLEMLGQHDGVCKINVLATDGRVVASTTFDSALATKTNIDLAHLPAALYYLQVFDAQGAVLHQQKIIKQ